MDFKHVSVLLEETIDGLDIKPDGIYVDGTLGGGGHAYEVCKRLSNKGRFIGIDQDGEALEAARKRLSEFEDKTSLVRSNYCEIDTILKDLNVEKVDGIVLDLGVSSYQIDNLDITPMEPFRAQPKCINPKESPPLSWPKKTMEKAPAVSTRQWNPVS